MTRHQPPVEQYVRQLPLVTDDQALLESDPRAHQTLFDAIVTTPLDGRTTAGRNARAGRRAVVLAAVLGLMSLAAVGWAVLSLSGQTTTVACHTEGDPASGIGIDLVTGDPVADCAAVWEQDTGQPPPPLAAYDNATGGIAVMPADVEVPDDWQPLESGSAQDPHIIELRVALDDHIAGLRSACHDAAAGEAIVQRELDRLDLSGWSLVTERGEADGASTCTDFHLDPERPRVVLYPADGLVAPDDAPYSDFARDLGAAIDDGCITLTEAAQLARQIAQDADIPAQGLNVHQIADQEATCARVHVTVTGVIEAHLRGPEDPA